VHSSSFFESHCLGVVSQGIGRQGLGLQGLGLGLGRQGLGLGPWRPRVLRVKVLVLVLSRPTFLVGLDKTKTRFTFLVNLGSQGLNIFCILLNYFPVSSSLDQIKT